MLRKTFLHISGIGKTTEALLWKLGFDDWSQVLDDLHGAPLRSADRILVKDQLQESMARLQNGEHQFFARKLGLRNSWRAYEAFADKCVYLDIETDGGASGSSITVIGLNANDDFKMFVKGENLEGFRNEISLYSMVVTFNGAAFDLPVLEKRFRSADFDMIHFDLYPAFRQIGIKGGLKKIEKHFGFERSAETEGLGGYDAVLLWRRYERFRDERALDLLLKYNIEDVKSLPILARHAYNGLEKWVHAEYKKIEHGPGKSKKRAAPLVELL